MKRFMKIVIVAILSFSISNAKSTVTPEEARAIAKEAYIYANPIIDNYRVMYTSFLNTKDPDYKGPWNQVINVPRVYTHEDRAVQTPNSDTPYSWLGLDLRNEPIVFTVPPIEKDRYFSIQMIDMYTHIFAYIGSRATGNEGGTYMIAGPKWKGEVPEGITKIIQTETELAVAIYRTQLFNPEDMVNVKKIMKGYKAEPLSSFLGKPAPKASSSFEFIKPLTVDEIKTSWKVFSQLNFALQFCPIHPSEKELMARFSKLDIGAGKRFDMNQFSPKVQKAIGEGIKDAWVDFNGVKKLAEEGKITSADIFGPREFLKNNYTYRMAAAVLGIWGNSADEAIYPSYYTDAESKPLDGSNRYTIHFEADKLPPVNSFWSLTMYELPASLLVENPMNRYLVNSTMMDQFKRDPDGGLTIYVQHESPGASKEANWLPAPKGPFSVVMRLYWPKKEALDGRWTQPKMQRVK
ncbi:MAG: DUF1254 domain-containing protein [Epsilonproteobacteria bacterium]|nr:MAG: DUF1254 domain-containing protein [Campylobacterota bacterium]